MVGFQSDIFIDAIILLMKSKDEATTDLVNQLIEIYTNDTKSNPDSDSTLNKMFVDLLNKLKKIPNSESSNVERSSLLVQFLTDPIVQRDDLIYNSLKELFLSVENSNIDEKQSLHLQKKLSNSILLNKCNKAVKKMFGKLTLCATTLDEDKQELYLNDAINVARKIIDMTQGTDRLTAGAIERVDFNDKKSIQKSLKLYNERENVYKLRTGLQGLNIMLGERKAFALGECVAFFALPHNFKSGILMTIARGLVKWNTPAVPNGKGKPLILFISLENEANRNVVWLYRHAYEQTFQKSSKGLTDAEIVDFVQSYYGENGFEFIMERRDGSKYGVDDHQALIESYESQGYWVVAVLVDYANKMKKGVSNNGSIKGNHNLVGDLFATLCTYHKTKGILFITAHQLNRKAQELVSSGKTDVVKYFTLEHVADSSDVSRELDLEVFMHLEKNQFGQRFLTCQRGKHRYVDDTLEAHKYFAYQFTPYGIVDDINTNQQFVRNIYTVDAPNSNTKEEEITMDSLY